MRKDILLPAVEVHSFSFWSFAYLIKENIQF
jgi:hypothetical protein